MILAAIPWAVRQVDRGIRWALRGWGGVPLLVAVLLVAATVPLLLEGAVRQPIRQRVDDLRDGVSALTNWVRLEGRVVTISAPESIATGQRVQSLLVEPSGDAILLLSDRPIEAEESVTGRVSNSANADSTARNVAGPRYPEDAEDVVERYVLTVDDEIVPPDDRTWLVVWGPLGAAALLAAGAYAGYPVVRVRRHPVQTSARPMRPGERMRLRAVEPEREHGLRLGAEHGVLERLERRDDADPYFSLTLPAQPRPLLFKGHRWSSAAPGTLWTALDRMPVVELHDWGVGVLLAFDRAEDRDRVLASFAEFADVGEGPPVR